MSTHPQNQAQLTALRERFPNTGFEIASVSDAGFPVTSNGIEMHLIETGPNERRWLSEEEVWELKRKGIGFFDVTFHPDL
jgi:hypothetical protein